MTRLFRIAVDGPLHRRTWVGLSSVTVLFGLLLGVGLFFQPPLEVSDERFHVDLVMAVMEGGGYPTAGSRDLTGDTEAMGRLLRTGRDAGDVLPGGASFDQDPPACSGKPKPVCSRSPRMEELEAYEGEFGISSPSSMTQHPPLFYALTAAGTSLVTGLVPIPVPIDLLLAVMRVVSLAWLIPLPFLCFALARQFGAHENTALLASLMVLLPSVIVARNGPMVNNDDMTIAVASAMLVVAATLVQRQSRSLRGPILLGALAGIAVLTKGLLLAFPLLVVLVPALSWLRKSIPLATAVRHAIAGGVAFVLFGGWWLVRNLVQFNSLQPRVARLPVPAEPTSLGVPDWAQEWAIKTTRSVFGGWMPWTRSWLLWLAVAAIVAVVVIGVLRLPTPTRWLVLVLAVPPGGTVLALAASSLRGFLRKGLVTGAQGRYLLVGLALVAALVAVGLSRRFPRPPSRWVASAVVVGLGVLQIHSLVRRLHLWPGDSLSARLGVARVWSPVGPEAFTLYVVGATIACVVLGAVLLRLLWLDSGPDPDPGPGSPQGDPPARSTVGVVT